MPGAAGSAPTRNLLDGAEEPGLGSRIPPNLMSLCLGTGIQGYCPVATLQRALGRPLKVQRLLVSLGNDAHGRELIPHIGSVPHARAYPLGKLLQLGSH